MIDDALNTGRGIIDAVDSINKLGCQIVKIITLLDFMKSGHDKLIEEGYDVDCIYSLKDFNDKGSKEAIVAHDADLLECAVEAKELITKGFADMKNWLDNIKKRLKTVSAKNLFKQVEELHSNIWWEHLKKVPND